MEADGASIQGDPDLLPQWTFLTADDADGRGWALPNDKKGRLRATEVARFWVDKVGGLSVRARIT